MPDALCPERPPLITRLFPCPACRGRGDVPAWACKCCLFAERLGGARAPWFRAGETIGIWTDGDFPECLADPHILLLEEGRLDCLACRGTGQMPRRKTEAQWARFDRREAVKKKAEASALALVLWENRVLMRYSQKELGHALKMLVPSCEARCKGTGQPCSRRVVLGRMRCRLHGGLSTGARTVEGRLRLRATGWRASRKEVGNNE